MMLRRTLAAAVLLGLLAGALIAALVPDTRPATSAAAGAPDPGVAPATATVRRVAAPRAKPRGLGYVRLRATGPVTVEARVRDPRGGPDWAVRSFLAQRLARTGTDGTPGVHVIGRNRCFQLGRLHDGRFGWLTADGTFRPATIDLTGVPTRCGSRRPDLGDSAFAELRFTSTDPDRPAAEVLGAVLWGATGAAATATVRVAGRPVRPAAGPHGGLLAAVDPAVRVRDVTVTDTAPGRPDRRLLPRQSVGPFRAGSAYALAAEAPDPDGGLPYAVLVSAGRDGTCTMTGPRVVGDRAGSVDYALDTFTEDLAGGGTCAGPPAARRRRMPDGRMPPPWTLGSSGSSPVREPGADPAAGRIARRTAPGRVILAGAADADVASLTIASPADVRTVVPAGPRHGFIVVYGGEFATGTFAITTTYKNGRRRRDSVPAAL
jgi:hypothetical protein